MGLEAKDREVTEAPTTDGHTGGEVTELVTTQEWQEGGVEMTHIALISFLLL